MSPRVLLIGIDGADMQIVNRLIGEGKLPTFARLKREGASGVLRSVESLLSPIVWTSIATGRKPQDHGIFDFVEVSPDGNPIPITSNRRKVPALWNIVGEFGKTSGFIGWYASFPAERVQGFEISDRLAFHQFRSERATVGATFPEGLDAELYRKFGEPTPDLAATKTRFLSHPDLPVGESGQKRLEELSKIYATSEFYRKIAPDLQRKFGTDLLAVYFEGIDACGHLFMEDAPPRRPEVSNADYAAFSETVDRYYQYQDEVLADLLKLEGEDTVTIVCSDHGFKSGVQRPRISGRADTGVAVLWHRLHGVIFVHGHPVVSGSEIRDASIFDIAPTVAALLPVPLSRELPGHVLAGIFAAGTIPEHPRAVEKYAARPKPKQEVALKGDPETLRKLAALGYLTGVGKTMAHDKEGRTALSYLNEGRSRSASGDEDGALRCFGKTLELDPKNVNALSSAAGILISRRDYSRAQGLLDRALALNPDDVSVRLKRATLALQTGQWAAAALELKAASTIDDRLPLYHLLLAVLEDATGRPEEALRELDEAEKFSDVDDPLPIIWTTRAQIAASLGRVEVAETAVNRAAALAPESSLLG
ncbi:MAG: alkaline phosphatase family protein, partial [Thermoanaerobaculia bacterium]